MGDLNYRYVFSLLCLFIQYCQSECRIDAGKVWIESLLQVCEQFSEIPKNESSDERTSGRQRASSELAFGFFEESSKPTNLHINDLLENSAQSARHESVAIPSSAVQLSEDIESRKETGCDGTMMHVTW
jgi:hypothetical protein